MITLIIHLCLLSNCKMVNPWALELACFFTTNHRFTNSAFTALCFITTFYSKFLYSVVYHFMYFVETNTFIAPEQSRLEIESSNPDFSLLQRSSFVYHNFILQQKAIIFFSNYEWDKKRSRREIKKWKLQRIWNYHGPLDFCPKTSYLTCF